MKKMNKMYEAPKAELVMLYGENGIMQGTWEGTNLEFLGSGSNEETSI